MTLTATVSFWPALTTTLAAWACEPICAVTVQPAGPVADTLKGRSSGVTLVSVRVNENEVFEAPWRCATSVVMVTLPAASRDPVSSVKVVDAPEAVVPFTSIFWLPPVASAGTVTLRVTLVSVLPPGD